MLPPGHPDDMLDRLPAYHRRTILNAVIETPRGSRNKFKFDPATGAFELGKQLPAGAVFPYDFGFVPSTLGDDGDPLDVLVLLETATFPGCIVHVRLIGVIDGRQREASGQTEQNPRLIGVAEESLEYGGHRHVADLPEGLLSEIEHFFVSYNEATGKTYEPMGRLGPSHASAMVGASERRASRARSRAKRSASPTRSSPKASNRATPRRGSGGRP